MEVYYCYIPHKLVETQAYNYSILWSSRMEKIVAHKNEPIKVEYAINKAVAILGSGGVVSIPTDTLYALSASIINQEAVNRVFAIKNRDPSKPLPILTHSKTDISQWSKNLSQPALALLEAFSPGPLTLVVEKSDLVPSTLFSSTKTIAIRVPNSKITQEIISRLGSPITGTSANKSGASDPISAKSVIDSIGTDIDLIIDAGETEGGIGSTIVDVTDNNIRILREGVIRSNHIQKVCKIGLTPPTK